MGLFNKIKNVLFEEEEIEIPVEEPKKEIKKVEPKERVVVEKKKVVPEEIKKPQENYTDQGLFKAEKTFDFPMFDDKEFESMKDENLNKFLEEKPQEKPNVNVFEREKPRVVPEKRALKTEEIKGRAYKEKAVDVDSRKFRPSPVISPVYGVLDKNYKKEDIVVIDQEAKKSIDVAEVRKKAFGTLENDVERYQPEKTIEVEEPKEEKSIDELLEETAFDSIKVPDLKEEMELEDVYNDEDDAVITLDELSEKKEKIEQQKVEDEDTLESDLFDLIDSMYENKEDE